MSNSERIVKGILGTKLGMTQLWDENNKIVPVTVIQAGPCVVTQVRTPEKDGYSAVQLGFGAIASRKVTKPAQGHFDKAGVTPRRHLLELRTANASEFTLGQQLTAELFAGGEFVDVTWTTKGKGTAGVMKRHGFGGLKVPTVCTASTAHPVPSVAAPPPVACSRASAWRVAWVTPR